MSMSAIKLSTPLPPLAALYQLLAGNGAGAALSLRPTKERGGNGAGARRRGNTGGGTGGGGGHSGTKGACKCGSRRCGCRLWACVVGAICAGCTIPLFPAASCKCIS
jgi:hypothetical protein